MKEKNSLLSNEKKTSCRSAVGQLNWVAGISRPDISFPVCEPSTKFKQFNSSRCTISQQYNRKCKNSKNEIRFPQLNLNNIKLQLFSDASFNNLPNGGSQAGQIIFLTDAKSNTCPLYWNSSKIKRVAKSTIAAETLSLQKGVM